jgi:hypothetical protein
VYGALEEGGKLVLEFRDYTADLQGVDQAIPVRLDEDGLMVTFLEYEPLQVNVHDVVFLKEAGGWSTQKSAYKKLRVGTEKVVEGSRVAGAERVLGSRNSRGRRLFGSCRPVAGARRGGAEPRGCASRSHL